MNKIYQKYRSFLTYTLFGTLASAVNILVFHILFQVLNMYYLSANVLAYLCAILFSFFTTKTFVFHSNYTSFSKFMRELTAFFTVRLVSFFLDSLIMMLGMHLTKLHPDLIKLIDQVLVGILNYFFSKWFIFTNTKKLKNAYKRQLYNKK
ncbi:GtrA family protein [Ligilactobacillus sp. Marseille-Q7487]|uniref:GtrA family protein n=1 Tax=Ligilactobacillus sp. Marseille-Q7487 TaxID=3022128 RepID=UPI0024A7F5CB|nr:GtrA family protein [Ligilactobacillus sp. Marseille-Q7487]